MALDEVGVPKLNVKLWLLGGATLLLGGSAAVAFATHVFASPEDQKEVETVAGEKATTHPRILQALGAPVFARHGKSAIDTSVVDGTVSEGTVPLEGSRLKGTLYYRARRKGEGEAKADWQFEVLRVTVQPSHEEINLLTEPDDVSLYPPTPPTPAPAPPPKTKGKHRTK